MGSSGGPNKVKSGLVFGYDTGYAPNSSFNYKNSPRRFFKGKPADNKLITEANWLHVGTEINHPKQYPVPLPRKVKFYKGAYNNGISWTDACRNYTDSYAAGTQITVSGWHMFYSTDTSLTMNSRNRLGWHYSKDGTSTYGGTIYTATEWNKWYYFSNTFSSTGTTTSLRVEDGGYDYYLDSADASNTTQYYCNLQIEIGTDKPSPYVNGSRGNTDALKDLTKNNDVDISNVSFDSNSLPTFDGTDDAISTTTGIGITDYSQPFSMECVFRVPTGATWANSYLSNIFSIGGSYAGQYGFYKTSTDTVGFQIRDASTGSYPQATGFARDVFHHVVGVWQGGSGLTFYKNGQSADTDTASKTGAPDTTSLYIGGRRAFGGNNGSWFEGDIPVAKYYDRALTAQEVKSNFNAYRKRFNL